MTVSRRAVIAGLAAAAIGARARLVPELFAASPRPPSWDPWLEVESDALAHNAATISGLAGGRQVIAVAKNTAYGTGLEASGPILDRLEAIWGFGVVRGDEARALRAAGVNKPILLMGPASPEEAEDLVRANVRLAPYSEHESDLLISLARRLRQPVPVHLYVDTGMHRMGMPEEQVLRWLATPGLLDALRIEGTFTELTEDQEFDREQSARLAALRDSARRRGISLGHLHAASSDAILRPTRETFFDLVRPGLALYGGYPTEESRARGELRAAYRLKARVLRVDRLESGEGVSYHRRWKAEHTTWVATLGIGHVDGYPAGAVRGCEVLIRGSLYPVVGTVSASHTVVALGSETPVQAGDEATLVGPDHPAIHPNEVALRAEWPEYAMFMRLNPLLDRVLR